MNGYIWRTILAWLGLTALQAVAGALLLARVRVPAGASWLAMLASTALTALAMAWLARRMTVGGWPRALLLFAVGFGIQANNLIEAIFFSLDIPRATLPLLFADGFVVSLAFALLLDRLAGPPMPAPGAWPAGRGAGAWLARVVACDASYVLVYLVAGAIVWPFVSQFYAGRPLPGLGLLVSVQAVRALVFIGLLLLLAARLAGSRQAVALLGGVTLAILGGVAPLLAANPYMPDSVRLAHLGEVGVSNFVYGWLAMMLLTGGRPPSVTARA